MNSECQKMLARERQQHCRSKKYSEKENIDPQLTKRTKRTKRTTEKRTRETNLQIPKACVYPWISHGLTHYTLGGMNYRCSNCNAMMWLNERTNKSDNTPEF